MKTIYIGDIHGNLEAVRKVRDAYGKDYRKIFMGDLIDTHLGFTRSEQFECVNLVLEMIKVDGNTECLLGNHEISYLLPHLYQCSGYSHNMEMLLMPLKNSIWKHFKGFIYSKERKILVTHAGLTKKLWEEGGFTFDNLEEKLTEWFAPPYAKSAYDIGWARGGSSPIGGPLWCDFNDEFTPIEGLIQIFGHTPDFHKKGGIRIRDNNYNVDCIQDGKILLEEDGKFTEINLGEK